MASAVDEDLKSFDVPETTRHSGGHTIYKIVLQVTPKDLSQNSYQMVYWKRYTDIRKLYDVLNRYHHAIYRPGKFPDFPDKSRFAERFNPVVVEERRVATKSFLNFALQQLYLRTHDAYRHFFENGDKVALPDVKTAALEPQSITTAAAAAPTAAEVEQPAIVEPVPVEKKDELLLNVDEDEQLERVNNACTAILDDLNDLQFEQQIQIEKEKAEFDLVKSDVDEATNLLSMPFTVTTNSVEKSS